MSRKPKLVPYGVFTSIQHLIAWIERGGYCIYQAGSCRKPLHPKFIRSMPFGSVITFIRRNMLIPAVREGEVKEA